ncbi:MAG: hypothetical protein ACT4PU_11650 [Planctomycetota bacterium]
MHSSIADVTGEEWVFAATAILAVGLVLLPFLPRPQRVLSVVPGGSARPPVPARRSVRGLALMLVVAFSVAQAVAYAEEARFLSSCRESAAPMVYKSRMYPLQLNYLLYLRSPDGTDTLLGGD